MLMGGLVLAAMGRLRGESLADLVQGSVRSWAAWWYIFVVASCVAFPVYVWLVTHVPLTKVGTYAFVNPLLAVALGTLVAGEALGPAIGVGMAAIVGGVAIVHWARHG